MTISEIENLSHAEIKAQHHELVQEATEFTKSDLAARWIQARADAKLRDEKLAEQGKTISALQGGHDALQGQLAHREQEVKELTQKLEDALKRVSAGIAALQEQKQATGAEMMRADKAEALAKSRRTILAKIMSDISPLLAEE